MQNAIATDEGEQQQGVYQQDDGNPGQRPPREIESSIARWCGSPQFDLVLKNTAATISHSGRGLGRPALLIVGLDQLGEQAHELLLLARRQRRQHPLAQALRARN